ncbi:MAG: HlyC/CorC family transporter [Propionibacterium sp.]|nr:HlyC/CorC family transporter [Propionibacterium sp.]
MGLDVALIALFILIGGTFAAAEMALVTLRDSQVRQLASKGKRGRAIEHLMANPNNFLSSVQIGVTVSGFLSASFGASAIAPELAPYLERIGIPDGVADTIALVGLTLVISYFSIVVGELTAKRLAMQRAETFALALAPLVSGIATLMRPVIWLLDHSTNALVRILGGDPSQSREVVSDEEIRQMVSRSETLGTEERRIVEEVFQAGELSLREVMVPRTEVDFLPAGMPIQQAYREVRGAPRSRYPVTDGSADRVIGFLHVRDLMDVEGSARGGNVRNISRPILNLPETVKILPAMTSMRKAGAHIAIVRDEYGGTAGIVTLEDLMEELIGDITDEYDVETGVRLEINQVDGLATIEDFADLSGYVIPEGPYDTVAGFFMSEQGRLPKLGDAITVVLDPVEPGEEDAVTRFTFEVSEMDGRRAAWFELRQEDGSPQDGGELRGEVDDG